MSRPKFGLVLRTTGRIKHGFQPSSAYPLRETPNEHNGGLRTLDRGNTDGNCTYLFNRPFHMLSRCRRGSFLKALRGLPVRIFVPSPQLAHRDMEKRPYVESDFTGLKREDFVALIKRQLANFPQPEGRLTKINVKDMKAILLDPALGFTTANSVVSAISNQKNVGSPSDGSCCFFFYQILRSLINWLEEEHRPSQNEYEALNHDHEPPVTVKAVQLLIDDNRTTFSDMNVSQRVDVTVVDLVDCNDSSGRIGVPDRHDPSYTEYFMRIRKRERSPSPDPAAAFQNLLPVVPASPAATRVRPPTDQQITWLKEKIRARSGYSKFETNHSKVLQNAERVEYWQFASQVSETFFRSPWPADISSNKTITKGAIQDALGIGSTSLTEAINMTRIIKLYTCDGPNRSDEVVSEVTKSQETEIPGAGALKAFLQKWENDHPVVQD
ncbi:hypothetical protein B0H10DRAFT_1941637 [Mycena sp. CBHHK59/15]|nr:hypothetical protein B0H10DRAFT_1941637 [Mycena sp. CBHHK59/15]